MAVNPAISPGGNRAHTQATVLGLLKKSQQNRAPAFESRQVTAKRFVGPRNLPDQLIGCLGLCPLDPISLNISTERAQGHFLSPWSKSGASYTKRTTIFSLCVSVRFEKAYCWCFEKIANFFLSFSLLAIGIIDIVVRKKLGGGGR
jgi:hypothetical protein